MVMFAGALGGRSEDGKRWCWRGSLKVQEAGNAERDGEYARPVNLTVRLHFLTSHSLRYCHSAMASKTISPADRIRELATINAEVTAMLQSAGHAINALTPRPVSEDNATPSLDDRKEAFTHHTEAYYTGLQSIVAQLRRQAYALEEAGIIAPEASSITATTQQQRPGAPATAPDSQRITNAGLGNLDVGWLNSRGNKVGAEKENELVDEAKKLLQDVLAREEGAG